MKKKLPYIIIFGIIAIIVIVIVLNQPKKTIIPNVVGMTVEQVQKIADEANWDLSVKDSKGRDVNNKQAVIVSQQWKAGDTLSEDSIFMVYVQEDENISDVENVIKEFSENVRNSNNGSVKYHSYSLYKTAPTGNKVYKIRYTTSANSLLYYQLVSLDSTNTKVNKSSRLFTYSKLPDGSEIGETQELEFEYNKLWEN